MTGLVLDCSATLPWVFEDEASLASIRLLARVEAEGAVVPAIWLLEVANILILAERKGRIPVDGARQRLDLLRQLPVTTEDGDRDHLWTTVAATAARERLTVYDATYLDLAMRRTLPLATKDRDLIVVARRREVEIIPLLDA